MSISADLLWQKNVKLNFLLWLNNYQTGTVINTLMNSHRSKRRRKKRLSIVDTSFSQMWKYSRSLMWQIELCKMPHSHRKKEEKANVGIIVIARWLYESFSYSLSSLLFSSLSFSLSSLCTITRCKVILSNWYEMESKKKKITSLHGILSYSKPS